MTKHGVIWKLTTKLAFYDERLRDIEVGGKLLTDNGEVGNTTIDLEKIFTERSLTSLKS